MRTEPAFLWTAFGCVEFPRRKRESTFGSRTSPSDALRKRFHARPAEWNSFRSAYAAELERETAQSAIQELRACLRLGPVTLLYAARDESRNNAVALKLWLES
jgi:uncharacterized protein YeaO (DUF488 family)